MSATNRSTPFDAADYLGTSDEARAYLNAALEDGDERVMLAAIRDVVRARDGITGLARRTGLSREALYQALSGEGNPRLSTLMAILRALDLEFAIVRRRRPAA